MIFTRTAAVVFMLVSSTICWCQQTSPGKLLWSDEFSNTNGQPDPKFWTYDAGGHGGFGNNELETYCAWGSNTPPCDSSKPNAYVGPDGYLHVVARKVADGVYTSARLKTEGLYSMKYGRIEARIKLPQGQGLWPAFWLLGDNIKTVNWPACGEQDVMEHINGPHPDWIEGSVHGIGFTGDVGLGKKFYFSAGKSSADWHVYGMTWSKGKVSYYVDDPAKPYVTYTTADLKGMKDAVWPFDKGQSNFIILNLAVGGDWPKSPDATTPFPAEMLVDYVRVYSR
jgi:beta-glucanase (GH16 family)